jgi:hypothetical protein
MTHTLQYRLRNTGSWSRGNGYTGRIVSFGPVSSSSSDLARRAARDAAWQAHNVALGSTPATAEISVARRPQRVAVRTASSW